MDYQHDCMAFKMHNEDSVVYTTLVSTSRAEWDGCSDGLPLSPRYESRLEGVSFT